MTVKTATQIAGALKIVRDALVKEATTAMVRESEDIADAMRAEVDDVTGNTRKSIRVVKRRRNKVLITAGGRLTTKEVSKGSGVLYDYVLAEEYGTKRSRASPFFFPTFRRWKSGSLQRITNRLKSEVDNAK